MMDKNFDKRGFIGSYRPPGSIDPLGRTVGSDGWVDGGDSLHRMGMYHFGIWASLSENIDISKYRNRKLLFYEMSMKRLSNLNKTKYKRHTDSDFWYSEYDRMSRDQMIPNLIAWGAWGLSERLSAFFLGHLRRGLLFMTNTRKNGSTASNHGDKFRSDAKPLKWYHKLILKYKTPLLPVPDGYRNYNWKLPDLTGPEFLSYYIRGLGLKWLYPVLMLLDLELMVNAIIKNWWKKEDSDVLNHVVSSIYANKVMPTMVSRFTNKYINSSRHLDKKMYQYFNRPGEPAFLYHLYKPLMKSNFGA